MLWMHTTKNLLRKSKLKALKLKTCVERMDIYIFKTLFYLKTNHQWQSLNLKLTTTSQLTEKQEYLVLKETYIAFPMKWNNTKMAI